VAGSLDRSVVSTRQDDIFDAAQVDHFELVDPEDEAVVTLDGPVVGFIGACVAPNADSSAIETLRRSRPELGEAGVVALHVGRRMNGHQTELAILAVWRDRPSLHRFARQRDGALISSDFLTYTTGWSFATYDCLSPERLTIPSAGPAVLLADDEGRYVDASAGVEAVLGVPGELILRRSVADLTAPSLRDQFRTAWSAFLGERRQSGEYEMRLPDGRQVSVRFRAQTDVPEPGLHASVLSRPGDPVDDRPIEDLVAIAFASTAALAAGVPQPRLVTAF
jgi:PAS domain-containing protein